MQTLEQQFELIELALRGEADGTEAVDALMDLKSKFLALAEVEGNITVHQKLAWLPDGTTVNLECGEK
jgi:hypothetical protein